MPNGIVIIEHRRETVERMQTLLTDEHYIVTATIEADKGMQIIEQEQPDLILLDADIMQGRGMSMAEEFKSNPETSDIPVILITTPYKSKEFIEQGIKQHVDGFIFIPFDENDFLGKVSVGIKIRELNLQKRALINKGDERKGRIKELENELAKRDNKIRMLENIVDEERTRDILTGLFNRKEFLSRLEMMVYECIRYEETLALYLYDIDHLDVINNEFGEVAGNQILNAFAAIVRKHSRTEDVVARFGPDEFIVAYKRMREDFVEVTAKRIKSEIEACELEYRGIVIKFTACLGISCNHYYKSHRLEAREDLVHEAQIALRNAKRRGAGSYFIHPSTRKR